MPQHEYLDRVGPLAPHHQDDQLEHLPKNQVPEREDHAAQHAASCRSHGTQKRTSTPMAEFPNGTGSFWIHRSMIAFMRGMRTPVSTTAIPVSARIVSSSAGYLPSRSRIRNRARLPESCRSIVKLRIAWPSGP